MSLFTMFFWLLVGHGVCDYPLQGDFLARGKNHKTPIPGIPWQQCLLWHAVIHGGAVALVTGSVVLGVSEIGAHLVIDYGKCEGVFGAPGSFSFTFDQMLHIVCKGIWVWIAFAWK